jgi:hypothetical protein
LAVVVGCLAASGRDEQNAKKGTREQVVQQMDAKTIAAFKKLGGEVGRMVKDKHGWISFKPAKENAKGVVLPAIMFRTCDDELLAKLPQPMVPFALNFISATVSDAGLKHLADLKQLHWLYMDATEMSDAGLKHLADLKRLWGCPFPI